VDPDLVLCFSDLQAGIAADLMRAGVAVVGFNQHDVAGILARHLGALVGQGVQAARLADHYEAELERMAERHTGRRPVVYFEEWDEPMIYGIRWVSELISFAGGRDAFEGSSHAPLAKDRIVTSDQVIATQPDVIIASWCGKKVRPEAIAARRC